MARLLAGPTSSPTRPTSCRGSCSTGGRPAFKHAAGAGRDAVARRTASTAASSCARTRRAARHARSTSTPRSTSHDVRDWNAPGNIMDDVTRINQHPAREPGPARLAQRHLPARRRRQRALLPEVRRREHAPDRDEPRPVPRRRRDAAPAPAGLGIPEDHTFALDELVSGEHLMWRGGAHAVRLDPAHNPAAIYRLDARLRVDYANPSL